jgi:hypothetical protein
MWFAVHILIGHSDAESDSEEIVVEENVCVVECETAADAERLGMELAGQYARTKISYLDPRPSNIEPLGVRRVVEISNPDLGADTPPQHQTEITYEVLKFANRRDVENYRNGISVKAAFWREPK